MSDSAWGAVVMLLAFVAYLVFLYWLVRYVERRS
jgi:cbb3-type cytochrome oxidase subunit 3